MKLHFGWIYGQKMAQRSFIYIENFYFRVNLESERAVNGTVKNSGIWENFSDQELQIIYAVLISSIIIVAVSRSFMFYILCLRSSVKLVVSISSTAITFNFYLQFTQPHVQQHMQSCHAFFQHKHIREDLKSILERHGRYRWVFAQRYDRFYAGENRLINVLLIQTIISEVVFRSCWILLVA